MTLTPCSCRKGNWLTIYENQCLIARNSTSETLLIGGSIIKGLPRNKGTWYKYFPNSFNFRISGDCAENAVWGALILLDLSYLRNVFILCGTNDICSDSSCDIMECLIDIGVCFWKCLPKVKIAISRIFPRDECYSVNRILIKEINTILNCKCAFHCFNFIEQEQICRDKKDTLDPSLFY